MNLLDDLRAVRRIDRSDMLAKAAAFPGQCREGWSRGLAWKVPSAWSSSGQFLVLGMGGSAIGADLLSGFLQDQLSRPVIVNRTYTLPSWVGRTSFVLVSSYSGNTEETLSAARAAAQKGARLAAITSGGKLAAWAKRAGFPLLQIPAGLPPRAAVGFGAWAPLGLLVRLGWVSRESLPADAAFQEAQRWIESRLAPTVPSGSNPAKRLAASLIGRLPILYGASGGWEAIAFRWRTQLEENAKTLAFHHLFPEATHNEISGWLEPRRLMSRMSALFLTDPAIHPRILRRMEFVRRIVRQQGAQAVTVEAPGRLKLSRMLGLISLGDFVSIYLGLLYRMDPTPVERVEALKRYMAAKTG